MYDQGILCMTTNTLQPLLPGVLTKRIYNKSCITDRCAREAAKELLERMSLFHTDKYHEKLDESLMDSSKFQCISKILVDNMKCETYRIIKMANTTPSTLLLPTIMQDYGLGYIYGNEKMQKPGNPWHPITSRFLP